MDAIKLLNIGTVLNNVTRLQSQLYVNTDTADFILEDGVLKCWGSGNKGFDFYETNVPYVIVEDIKEMQSQNF